MVYVIFFVAMFIFLSCVSTNILDDFDEGVLTGLMITFICIIIWFLIGAFIDSMTTREDTLIQTSAIVYNKNTECYVYMNSDENKYKLIQEDKSYDVISYDKSKTDIIPSDENVVEVYKSIPVNKWLDMLFILPDYEKYVIKTNEVKMILK